MLGRGPVLPTQLAGLLIGPIGSRSASAHCDLQLAVEEAGGGRWGVGPEAGGGSAIHKI